MNTDKKSKAQARRPALQNSADDFALDFSQALAKGEARLVEVRDLRPVIRLPPPRRGFRHIKRGYHDGGDLGYRGKEINELLLRMVVEEAKDGL